MFWSYLTTAGNAPLGHRHLFYPFIYGSPAFPLLSRTPNQNTRVSQFLHLVERRKGGAQLARFSWIWLLDKTFWNPRPDIIYIYICVCYIYVCVCVALHSAFELSVFYDIILN
jgi:hypothetical protein